MSGMWVPFRNITPRGSKIAWVLCGVLSAGIYLIPDKPRDEKYLPWDDHKNPGAGVAGAGTGTRASDITPKQPMIGPALPPQQR